MGKFLGRSCGIFLRTCFAVAVCLGLYTVACGSSTPTPPDTKKISIIVVNLSDLPPMNAIRLEENVGQGLVVPLLLKLGYDIEHVFSLTRLAIENGSVQRALIKAYEQEPDRDEARILMLSVHARPGEEPGTISSSFALIDTHVSDLLVARANGVPATSRKIWAYEAPEVESTVPASFPAFNARLQTALSLYDRQYVQKLETHQYPPLAPGP